MATTGSGTSTPVSIPSPTSLGNLILGWRRRLDDEAEPFLWTNEEITEFADRLQKELAGEMPILEDRTTPTLFQVAVIAGDGILTLSARIRNIIGATIVGADAPLKIVGANYMNAAYPGWSETEVAGETLHLTAEHGTPQYLVIDGFGLGKAVLYPPLEDATAVLEINAFRMPLLDLDYTLHAGEELEINRFAHLLVYGIMFQAFTKNDADTGAGSRAEQYRVLWEGRDGNGGDKERIKRLVWMARLNGASGVMDIV